MHFGAFVLILPRVEGNLVAPHQHLVGLILSSLLPPACGHHPAQSYCWKTLAQHPQTCREAIWIPRRDNFSRGFLLRQCWYNTSSRKTLLPAALQLSLLNPHHHHLAFYFSPPSLPVINRCDVISGLLLASPGAPR